MRKFGVVFILILSSFVAQAQFLDTLKSSFKHKPTIDFKFNSRYNIIDGDLAKIWAVKVGLDFNKKFRFGVAAHYFNDFDTVLKIDTQIVVSNFRMNFVSLYTEYVFFSKKWELSLPIQYAFGQSFNNYKLNNEFHQLNKGNFAFIEVDLDGHYRIIKYIGAGFGVGYRFMILNNNLIKKSLNSPIFTAKIKIFLGDIYRDKIRKK